MPSARTHYDTLNVSPDAEIVVIEAAYRALMKRYHPDQGAAAAAAGGPSAAAINEAYAVLRDPAQRAAYDRVEWIRQKDFRIAQYSATVVAPPSRFFGWGGWLVALVLGAMIAIMAGRGIDPPVPSLARIEPSSLSAAPAPSVARKPAERLMRAAEEATKVDPRISEYIARDLPPPAPAADELHARAVPVQALPVPAPRAAPPPRARYRAYRRAPAVRTARREKDFLERQGGIY
jgi:hypothetical protein